MDKIATIKIPVANRSTSSYEYQLKLLSNILEGIDVGVIEFTNNGDAFIYFTYDVYSVKPEYNDFILSELYKLDFTRKYLVKLQ